MPASRRLLVCLAALATACSGQGPGGPHPIPWLDEGKADNYVSDTAREFLLSGVAHAALPADWATVPEADRPARLEAIAEARLATVSRSIRSHIDGVIAASNGAVTGEEAKYFTYARRGSSSSNAVEVLPEGRVRFAFELELVGSVHLMAILAPDSDGPRTFSVVVKDYSDAEGEQVDVTIAGSPSDDAFPRYDALFADGVFDLAIHFGGDYNAERYDIETAKWTVQVLLESGWAHPTVKAFEDLTFDSGPFVKAVKLEGRDLEVRVYVYHSDMDRTPEEKPRLAEVMRQSFAERDVVMYEGHAGEGAGFILDYQGRAEISAREFADLPLAEKYQIYVFDGCQTYRTYVTDLMQNPRKTFENVNVVTTINTTPFSAGYQVLHEFLFWLTITDESGAHYPLSWLALLRGVNEGNPSVHYGVHGVDQGPKLNPHGGADRLCAACEADSACGAGGNYCLDYPTGAGCGVACTTDQACGDGYRCATITDDPELFYLPKQCVRRDTGAGCPGR